MLVWKIMGILDKIHHFTPVGRWRVVSYIWMCQLVSSGLPTYILGFTNRLAIHVERETIGRRRPPCQTHWKENIQPLASITKENMVSNNFKYSQLSRYVQTIKGKWRKGWTLTHSLSRERERERMNYYYSLLLLLLMIMNVFALGTGGYYSFKWCMIIFREHYAERKRYLNYMARFWVRDWLQVWHRKVI